MRGKLKFVPVGDANGTSYDSFQFKVHDGTEYSASAYAMTVDVTAVQDAPTAGANTVTTNEDTALHLQPRRTSTSRMSTATLDAADPGHDPGDGWQICS